MTLQEMLEAVQLDALGMLEGDERRAFEAAFDAAHPAIQEQVRAEQARYALNESEFSDAVPPAALRERVLGAINAEILADAHTGLGLESDESLSESRPAAAVLAQIGSHAGGRAARRTPAVSPMWRAASLGFATAAAILMAAFFSMSREMDSLQHRMGRDSEVGEVSKGYGGSVFVEAMFGKDVQRYVFNPAAGVSTKAEATLLLLPGMKQTRLFVKDLEIASGQSGRVLLLDDSGRIVKQLSEFAMDDKISNIDTLNLENTAGQHLAIAVAKIGSEATAADIRLIVHAA